MGKFADRYAQGNGYRDADAMEHKLYEAAKNSKSFADGMEYTIETKILCALQAVDGDEVNHSSVQEGSDV